MRKHNIGRISFIILLLNIIFILVYLADKNDMDFKKTETNNIKTHMSINKDENVDGEYVTIFENVIANEKYSKDNLAKIATYSWYLTSNMGNTTSYLIDNEKITIYIGDDHFSEYVKSVLDTIIID